MGDGKTRGITWQKWEAIVWQLVAALKESQPPPSRHLRPWIRPEGVRGKSNIVGHEPLIKSLSAHIDDKVLD